jgi:2,3,4,5-tetrahydropyridine-2-carboxylate N-succinyltransferase
LRESVGKVLDELDAGRLRVAEKISGEWVTHQWIKKAVLLSFRLSANRRMDFGAAWNERQPFQFYDKVDTKFAAGQRRFAEAGVGSCRRQCAARRVHCG